ncbi:MAG: hypothetical protein H0W67_04340 [Gemmatimonadales bacterium]|nr:hypothetical protein [Gemmatimonadales bacterium]
MEFDSDSLLRQVAEENQKRIDDLRCPVHGEAPRIEFLSSAGSIAETNLHTCCEVLTAMVHERLGVEKDTTS